MEWACKRVKIAVWMQAGAGGAVMMDMLPLGMNLPGMPNDTRGLEKTMWAINKLLEDQDFETQSELEHYMNSLIGKLPKYEPKNDVEKAQSVVYDAYQAKGEKKRVRLARKALDICPDCADAYVILAEETAKDAKEAVPLYQQGVEAGERALGEVMRDEEVVGMFWDLIDARGYMRARFGLAEALWESGERRAAIDHARELLRLDEDDHQGVRNTLVNWLMRQGDDAGASQILKRYPEQMTHWLYSRALLTFREKGNSGLARTHLNKALAANPIVPAVFLGSEFLDNMVEGLDEDAAPAIAMMSMDALEYLSGAGFCWEDTPGAVDWLLAIYAEGPGSVSQKRAAPRKSGKSGRPRRR